MRKPIRTDREAQQPWDDPLVVEIRPVVQEAIERVLNEELARVLGAERYARVGGRGGYRNGSLVRQPEERSGGWLRSRPVRFP